MRMPDLEASEMTAVSTAANPLRHPICTDPSPTDGEPPNSSYDECLTSRSSSNGLTSSLKRPLPNISDGNNEIKKNKLFEDNYNDEQLNDTIISNTNYNKEKIVSLSSKTNDQIAGSEKTNNGNIPQESINTTSEKLTEDSIDDADLDSVSDKSCNNSNVKSPSSKIICEENHENEPSTTSNILTKCVPVISEFSLSSETIISRDNDVVENVINSPLYHRLTSDNLMSVENPRESSDCKDISSLEEICDEKKTNSNHNKTHEVLQSVSKNNSKITTELENTEDKNEEETVTGDNSSHTLDDVTEVLDSDSDDDHLDNDNITNQKLLDDIVNGVSNFNVRGFSTLMAFFNKNDIPFSQFESFVMQKCLQFVTDASERGKERSSINSFLKKEQDWHHRLKLMSAHLKEMKAVVKMHKEDLLKNPFSKPHLVTRTVGLQATFCKKDEISSIHQPKTLIPSVQQSNNDSVNIISDDDDIVEVQSTKTSPKKSNSKSTENTTPKKVRMMSPPRVTILKEALSSALPSVVDNTASCIDLTDDTADEPTTNSIACLTNTLVKIAPRPSTSVSQGSSTPFLIQNSSTQVVPSQTVEYIATSTPNILMRTSVPSSEQTMTSNLNTASRVMVSTHKRSSGGFIPINANVVKDGQRYALLTPVVNRQMHPINVAYARPIPTNKLVNLPPPPPPAIPINHSNQHPAPLPIMPNQKNLSSWKKLPPAPTLDVKLSDGGQSNALLLSWNMPVLRGCADITNYQIFAYHENTSLPSSDLWKKIGEVSSLPLPMACSLTQFSVGQKYHFAVRAVDSYSRVGPFSFPKSVLLNNN